MKLRVFNNNKNKNIDFELCWMHVDLGLFKLLPCPWMNIYHLLKVILLLIEHFLNKMYVPSKINVRQHGA